MKKITLCVLVCMYAVLVQAQSIITVDNNPGHNAQFASLQEAVDNASDGDTIYVQHSPDSYGSVNVNKRLTIIGRSGADPGFTTDLALIELIGGAIGTTGMGSSGSIIQGLNVGTVSIRVDTFNQSIQNISILNNNIQTLSTSVGGSAIFGLIIRGNIINDVISLTSNVFNSIVSNNILRGVRTSEPNTTVISQNIFRVVVGSNFNTLSNESGNNSILRASNNVFITNVNFDTEVSLFGNYQLDNNLTFNYSGATLNFMQNQSPVNIMNDNLLNTDPLFTAVDLSNPNSILNGDFSGNFADITFDPFNDDLIPAPGSPLLGNGFSGADIGIYNDGFVFQPFANATGIPYVKIQSHTSIAPTDGDIQVGIQAKTN